MSNLSQLVDNMISYGENNFLGIGRGFFKAIQIGKQILDRCGLLMKNTLH